MKDAGNRVPLLRRCISVGNPLYNGRGMMIASLSLHMHHVRESINEVTPDATIKLYSETAWLGLKWVVKNLARALRSVGEAAAP